MNDRLNKTATIGEIIGEAFRLVPCKCVKCGASTDCFTGWESLALCPRCDAIAVAERRRELAAEGLATRTKSWELRNMPLADTVLDKLPAAPERVAKVVSWPYGAKGLAVHGITGMGKSRAVLTLLRRLYVDEGFEFAYIRTPQWARDLEAATFTAHRQLVTSLFWVPVLVLDDVGKERPTERSLSALFDVIDTRTNHKLPVILTSNYNGDKLQARFAERDAETAAAIVRRIREFCTPIGFAPSTLKTSTKT